MLACLTDHEQYRQLVLGGCPWAKAMAR